MEKDFSRGKMVFGCKPIFFACVFFENQSFSMCVFSSVSGLNPILIPSVFSFLVERHFFHPFSPKQSGLGFSPGKRQRAGPDGWPQHRIGGTRIGAGGPRNRSWGLAGLGAWGPRPDGWHADRSWGPATLDGWHGSELAVPGSGWVARGSRWGSQD